MVIKYTENKTGRFGVTLAKSTNYGGKIVAKPLNFISGISKVT